MSKVTFAKVIAASQSASGHLSSTVNSVQTYLSSGKFSDANKHAKMLNSIGKVVSISATLSAKLKSSMASAKTANNFSLASSHYAKVQAILTKATIASSRMNANFIAAEDEDLSSLEELGEEINSLEETVVDTETPAEVVVEEIPEVSTEEVEASEEETPEEVVEDEIVEAVEADEIVEDEATEDELLEEEAVLEEISEEVETPIDGIEEDLFEGSDEEDSLEDEIVELDEDGEVSEDEFEDSLDSLLIEEASEDEIVEDEGDDEILASMQSAASKKAAKAAVASSQKNPLADAGFTVDELVLDTMFN